MHPEMNVELIAFGCSEFAAVFTVICHLTFGYFLPFFGLQLKTSNYSSIEYAGFSREPRRNAY